MFKTLINLQSIYLNPVPTEIKIHYQGNEFGTAIKQTFNQKENL